MSEPLPTPAPDYARAWDFLTTKFHPGRLIVITGITLDRKQVPTESFAPDEGAKFIKWVTACAAMPANCYFSVGEPIKAVTKKMDRSEISRVWYLHVDLDPVAGADLAAEQARILSLLRNPPAGIPLPTGIVKSGSGAQAYWKLDKPLPVDGDLVKAEDLKLYNLQLERMLGGDNCHNVDRVMRLPGTINVPDAKKLAKGRKPALAQVVEWHDDRVYPIGQFVKAPVVHSFGNANVANRPDVAPVRVDSAAALPISSLGQVVVANGADPSNPDRFKSRSEAVWFVVCDFARAILSAATEADSSRIEAQALGVLTDREWPISAHVFDQKSPERYARSQIRKALKEAAKEANAPPPEGAIVLADGRLNDNLRAAETALLAAQVPIYERGAELVRTVRLERSEESAGVRRDAGATVIVPVSDRWLVQRLADAAPFVRTNVKGDHVPADPPLEFARHLMDRQGEWTFPTLRGIVNAPTMRADGSILQSAGFDAASGLIFDPSGVEFPPIADKPTRDDAMAALAAIDELFALFPYERTEPGQHPLWTPSYAVTLSALLCLVARYALRTAPLHGNDSPTPGTGKTIQAEAVGIIGTGTLPAMMSQGPSEEELEKRIATALRAGDRLIVIDNVERPLGGDFLCSVLTQERVQARILGKSERVILPTAAVFIATGNNLQVAGDLSRRAVKGRIDSGEERPDRREFPFDPRQLARERRPELVAAALTILRAYEVAGRPVSLPAMGSFEDYSFVRGAIVWLDRADPGRTREAIFAADPKRDELTDLLRAWRDAFGREAVSLADAKTRLETSAELAGGPLYGFLVDLGGRGAFNGRAIGKRLSALIDRPAGGIVLRRVSESNAGARWRVDAVPGSEPEGPDYGEFAGMGWD